MTQVWGISSWGDFNNDGKLDILTVGEGLNGVSDRHSHIFMNNTSTANTAPESPTGLSAIFSYPNITFSWNKPTDSQTSQNGLSYNLYLYEVGQSGFVISPNANTSTGFRRISARGNIQWRSGGFVLKNIPINKSYKWSVQAVDAGLKGGPFSSEAQINVPLPVELSSFSGFKNNNFIELRWSTMTERNNSGFDVERKVNDSEWEIQTFVKGAVLSNSPKHYSFTDKDIFCKGIYTYRLKQIDNDGSYKYSNEIRIEAASIINTFGLKQNYPNPFNPVTTVEYFIPEDGKIKLSVYDIHGRLVDIPLNEFKKAGGYQFKWNAGNLSSGTYIFKLSSERQFSTRKIILLK